MEKVKRLIDAGARTGIAIREALLADRGLTVATFAAKYALNEKGVSNGINGNVRATDALVTALATELGGSPSEWGTLLWEASKPAAVVEAA